MERAKSLDEMQGRAKMKSHQVNIIRWIPPGTGKLVAETCGLDEKVGDVAEARDAVGVATDCVEIKRNVRLCSRHRAPAPENDIANWHHNTHRYNAL